jgi:hypothetical protein
MTEKLQNIQNITYKTVAGIMLTIIMFFGAAYFNKLEEVSTQIIKVQKDILIIQNNMLTRNDVENMIDNKIELYFYKTNNKK